MRWRARTYVQLHGALRARRPQLKRDPLGRCVRHDAPPGTRTRTPFHWHPMGTPVRCSLFGCGFGVSGRSRVCHPKAVPPHPSRDDPPLFRVRSCRRIGVWTLDATWAYSPRCRLPWMACHGAGGPPHVNRGGARRSLWESGVPVGIGWRVAARSVFGAAFWIRSNQRH